MKNRLASPGAATFSLTAEYALRGVIALALADGEPLKATEVARRIGAPANYMAKTLNALAHRGLVHSRRGPAGGFTLAGPPDKLSVAAIVDAFSEPRAEAPCLLGNRPCDPLSPCAAHERWSAMLEATRQPLKVTIADLILDDSIG